LLHIAAMYGHTKSTEALLDKGADIDALNGQLRETPLIIAAIYQRLVWDYRAQTRERG